MILPSDPRTDPPPPRLAVSLAPAAFDSSGGTAARLSALVRAATANGVRAFDLTEALEPQRCWDLAASAAGALWAESTVFVPRTVPSDPRPFVEPHPRQVVRFADGSEPGETAPALPDPSRGARFRDLSFAEVGAERAVRAGARWISVPGHLLDARRVRAFVERVHGAGGVVLLTNPHADGRLDGRWLAEGTLANDGPPRPLDLGELQRAYAPLLPLGFLTRGHRRTLAQAAVGFAYALGAVPSVRVRDLRLLEEVADPTAFPAFTAEELSDLETSVSGMGPPSAPAASPGFK